VAATSLNIVVPRTFFWWSALAVLADPAFDRYRSVRFSSTLPQDEGDVWISSELAEEANREALADRESLSILLWDGWQSHRRLTAAARVKHSDLVDRVTYLAVGDSRLGRFPGGPASRLLFVQDERRYRGLPHRIRAEGARLVSTRSESLTMRHRVGLLTAKHALREPRSVVQDPRQVIFAGQSGRITLSRHPGASEGVRARFLQEVLEFETGTGRISTSIPEAVRAFLGEPGPADDAAALMINALTRVFVLERIARADIAHRMLFFPHSNVNIYQSRLLPSSVYLDFGGMNGSELVYPRYADLLALGKTVARVPQVPVVGGGPDLAETIDTLADATVERLKVQLAIGS
jgi:hypothetical protein